MRQGIHFPQFSLTTVLSKQIIIKGKAYYY